MPQLPGQPVSASVRPGLRRCSASAGQNHPVKDQLLIAAFQADSPFPRLYPVYPASRPDADPLLPADLKAKHIQHCGGLLAHRIQISALLLYKKPQLLKILNDIIGVKLLQIPCQKFRAGGVIFIRTKLQIPQVAFPVPGGKQLFPQPVVSLQKRHSGALPCRQDGRRHSSGPASNDADCPLHSPFPPVLAPGAALPLSDGNKRYRLPVLSWNMPPERHTAFPHSQSRACE
ncbi:hypothetical protein IMSAG185_01153 [Lachnospiraceae bacterium]|nr:hypothetical protein IMSAG185_01153 [Lachnospiraceae bacterium]